MAGKRGPAGSVGPRAVAAGRAAGGGRRRRPAAGVRTPTSRQGSAPAARTAHFGPELFRFLRDLDRHNDKLWFVANRDRYHRDVRDPMLRFISEFAPHLRRISPQFVADPRPVGGSMFRIHRDVRFSRDKRPYKTFAAAQFRHRAGRDVHAPGFYLHLGLDVVFVGCGLWRPDATALRRIRDALVEHPDEWRRVLRGPGLRSGALRLAGDTLRRPPRGFPAEHALVEDLKRKDFITVVDLDEATACAPGLLLRVAGICRSAVPFVRFLTHALDLPF